ncbi:MAG TPA: permease-like cell division protein FtsX [Bacillota bacterium]|nr:permease-like cell division protein FtsX [Bacillota bacterium]
MKFRTMRRHIREGSKNILRNGWMSIASIGAVTTTLILVGAFLILILNLNQVADNLEKDVEINALIEPTADASEIKTLGREIEQLANVANITFSSKDEELEKLIDSMGEKGESWELFEQDNPLNHTYIIKPKDPDRTPELAKKIAAFDYVEEVNYGEEVVEKLLRFNFYARSIGLVLIVGLVLTAIFLISNTIKLTIMARSEEIGIMKLVGATNGFIRWPFFIEGMLLGMLGSIVPITAILGGYYYIEQAIGEQTSYSFIDVLPYNPFAWLLSLFILIIGAFIGIWGSVMSVRKFLKV